MLAGVTRPLIRGRNFQQTKLLGNVPGMDIRFLIYLDVPFCMRGRLVEHRESHDERDQSAPSRRVEQTEAEKHPAKVSTKIFAQQNRSGLSRKKRRCILHNCPRSSESTPY